MLASIIAVSLFRRFCYAHGMSSLLQHRSFLAIQPHLPPGSHALIEQLLGEIPCEILPVRPRRSKHGDHCPAEHGRSSRITVNVCGNEYQFLLTLLHELAHALVLRRYGPRAQPHGKAWKNAFSVLLLRRARRKLIPRNSPSKSVATPSHRSVRAFAMSNCNLLCDLLTHSTTVLSSPNYKPGRFFRSIRERCFALSASPYSGRVYDARWSQISRLSSGAGPYGL